MKTVNIKGKEYVEVKERIKHFRSGSKYEGWSMTTEIIKIEKDLCIMQAVIKDDSGTIRATGTAYETPSTNKMVNSTSYIENCETSAWGRALGNLGIGVDGSIASAEEVKTATPELTLRQLINNAVNHPNVLPESREKYIDDLKSGSLPVNQDTLDKICMENNI